MRISLNWIKEYLPNVKFDPIDILSEKMIASGLDIESVEDQSKVFSNFVIGEVIEKKKHPNADKLSLCTVNTGDRQLSVVCGAPNVETGQKVCVALVGAIIPNGNFEIKKSKIRGELSEGMICSERELNMSDKHDGILILNGEAKVGENFASYIKADDCIFEIGITPNRNDLNSHFGIAREIGAIYNSKITIPPISISETDDQTNKLIKITIANPELCKRFTGRIIKNVKIKESPAWLQEKIKAVGLRPINNIVDITNFVMYETGQPLHAFDYDRIAGNEILVKTANEGDKFKTLDSKERILNSDSLMICDANGYSGIAGIMGGEHSEVTDATKNIFLESAYFDPVSIRKNSKKLGLHTDASHRFERGVDIDMVKYASERASRLMQEIAGGEVSKGLYDVYPEVFKNQDVSIRIGKLNEISGINFTRKEVISLLEKIDFRNEHDSDEQLIFRIPEWRRNDVEREIDLIEEVLRLYGYDNITPSSEFRVGSDVSEIYKKSNINLVKKIHEHLVGRGFNQILSMPLTDGRSAALNEIKTPKILNSVASEINSMRTNLLPGMLLSMRNNFNNSGKDISLKLFESGRVFSETDSGIVEEEKLIIGLSGRRDFEIEYGSESGYDIFDIKGEAEMLLSKLNLDSFALIYYNDKSLANSKTVIRIDSEEIGVIYKVNNQLLREFDLDNDAYVAEFSIDKLKKFVSDSRYYSAYTKFPSIKRDIAIVVDAEVEFEKIRLTIMKNGKPMLSRMKLFDIFEDKKLGLGKKSLAMRLEFTSMEKTLTDGEATEITNRIVNVLEKEFSAKLRTQDT